MMKYLVSLMALLIVLVSPITADSNDLSPNNTLGSQLNAPAQQTCTGDVTINHTLGVTEPVLEVVATCVSQDSDGRMTVQLEITNTKQAVYYVSFAQAGDVGPSNAYLYSLDPVPLFPEQTIVLDVRELGPGGSITVMANKWGESDLQNARMLVYNLAYIYLRAVGVEPAYASDSRWQRIATLADAALMIPWSQAFLSEGDLRNYAEVFEASLGVMIEEVNETDEQAGWYHQPYRNYRRALAIVELVTSLPGMDESVASVIRLYSGGWLPDVTGSTVGQFFVKARVIELAILAGPRSVPVLTDVFYAPTTTATRVFHPPYEFTQEEEASDEVLLGTERVTSNADWTPVEREINGVTMVLVPAGCFMMGINDEQLRLILEEAGMSMSDVSDEMLMDARQHFGAHEQCFEEPFWISKYEVANAEYDEFVIAGGYDNSDYWTEEGWQERVLNNWSWDKPHNTLYGGDHPVENITWYEAVAYANWHGSALCSEPEWEYAARGPDGVLFPWGDEFNVDNLVFSTWGTDFVGSRSGGMSWVGALDMSGNVSEWTLSAYAVYPYMPSDGREDIHSDVARVARGGSFTGDQVLDTMSVLREERLPDEYRRLGFRICVSYDTAIAKNGAGELVFDAVREEPETDTLGLSLENPTIFNNQWSPIEYDFEGTTMVLVPSGCFMMGADEELVRAIAEESSQQILESSGLHEQCFDEPFWISKYELTNAEYADFVTGGGYDNHAYWTEEGWRVRKSSNWLQPPHWPIEGAEQPVIVSWYEAMAYATWRGVSLCTEVEWEYAARGPNGLIFPWGNVYRIGYDNSFPEDRIIVVGNYPNGASWVNALDMTGNVWEWVLSEFRSYPYLADDGRESTNSSAMRVLRGGAAYNDYYAANNIFRAAEIPEERDYGGFGFRICANATDDFQVSTFQVTTSGPTSDVTSNEHEFEVLGRSLTDPVTSNAQWTPVEREISGTMMVLVPAGCFMMGLDGEGGRQCFDEPFWIGKYEVTNAEYDQFFDADGYNNSAYWTTAGWYERQNRRWVEPPYPTDWTPQERQPVAGVSWHEAMAYVNWLGMSLCTEAEWEYAARGPDGLLYPWGNRFVGDNLVYADNSHQRPEVVGSRPAGASWVGAMEMVGNVDEWITSAWRAYPYQSNDGREDINEHSWRISRGGSWFEPHIFTRAVERNYTPPEIRKSGTGIRVCAPAIMDTSQSSAPQITADAEAASEQQELDGLGMSRANPVTSNAQWTPVEREINDTSMVLVPAGCFEMGENGEGDEQCFDEPFWIGRTEVTNAEYAEFIAAGGYDNPAYWTAAGWGERQSSNWTQPSRWDDSDFNAPYQPVVGVSWYEAMAYATWRGMTLPTERQWEYAARGPAGLIYPWGNEFDGARLNFCDVNCEVDWRNTDYDDGYHYTAPVGSYPLGASWVGALDMAGNVWNWTLSERRDYPYNPNDGRENFGSDAVRVLRGGSWHYGGNLARAVARGSHDPARRNDNFGFRVCVPPSSR